MLSIGPHSLPNAVALAPMAGVTDVPFRQLAWRLGVGYMVGEMTGSRPELANTRKTLLRREAVAGALHAVQIAGTESDWMAQATRSAILAGAQLIDINFGCPAKKVCRKAAGSALMAEPERLLALADAVLGAAREFAVPVTVKMRTGPDPESRNAPQLARALEDLGVSALAIHGRTRACKFVGAVEYDTIAAVVAAVAIPVFANGDVCTPRDARLVLAQTGAAGVMIGRAALGAPWLPGWIATELTGVTYDVPNVQQRLSWLREQLLATHAFYGEQQGVRIARKHVAWTLQHPTLVEQASGANAGLKSAEDLAPKTAEATAAQQEFRALSRALLRAGCANEQLDLLDGARSSLAA